MSKDIYVEILPDDTTAHEALGIGWREGYAKGKEDCIREIELFKAEIEWDESLEYQIIFDMLLERLKGGSNG